ncbi:bifunctional DNA-formamidopyrimidine glycosylase/DNA-(apurinic or apyrimidinic site) lyase [Demequina flava]|uniref:bifunctional DNA-formamidopyrimidine glycosylase/DNA-(apurinic or apyrimidinic site) lyase n=1 Tax=Demequina flava TaxID=1095025 RepID=UPI0007812751|nr:bifunctional DNA-formamidopyrimidine glycosylase/DNA-(apurinic or apyrimidinic site) lyase [Demequina flava]
MPELPEVETVRAGLVPFVTGALITSVDVRRDSCVRLLPGGSRQFQSMLVGSRIVAPVRRGKFLWMPLEHPADAGVGKAVPVEAFSAHLGMSGQFRVHTAADAPQPHSHCRARLALRRGGDEFVLDFLDQRTFGYLHVEELEPTVDGAPGGAGDGAARLPVSVSHIGRDALDPHLDERAAMRSWRRGTRGIKQVMLDQSLVSGIGNIYADEALWHARVHPQRPAHAVTSVQARTLVDAARTVMSSALRAGGTSFDALYVNVNGESGYFERGLEAYGRAGEPCARCGSLVQRASVGGRATHWCARCQRRYSPRGVSR